MVNGGLQKSGFDETLLRRVEDAGLNASAPPQQLWMHGWLVRFSPGKAKRALRQRLRAGAAALAGQAGRVRAHLSRCGAAIFRARDALYPTSGPGQ
jgi:hypothetical protein